MKGPSLNKYDHESSQTCTNAITRSRAKLVLKVPMPSPSVEIEQHKDKALAGPSSKGVKPMMNVVAASYSILDQLQRTNAQFIIFELLKISPTHRKILDKALTKENVP